MLRREDIAMTISAGGKERILEEFERLVKEADKHYKLCSAPRMASREQSQLTEQVNEVHRGKDHFCRGVRENSSMRVGT